MAEKEKSVEEVMDEHGLVLGDTLVYPVDPTKLSPEEIKAFMHAISSGVAPQDIKVFGFDEAPFEDEQGEWVVTEVTSSSFVLTSQGQSSDRDGDTSDEEPTAS